MATRPARAREARPPPAPYDRSVFVNCPFDADYLPLLHALVFAIHDCGYLARLAIEDTGGAELRVDKITRLIRESRFSIHDISRVDVNATSPLPRFNMPFEAGVAFGACRFDKVPANRSRDFLLLEAQAYRDQRTLSDLAGQDTRAHANDAQVLIRHVRTFLARKWTGPVSIRGAAAIWGRYQRLQAALPAIAETLEVTVDELLSFDYLKDLMNVMVRWIATTDGR